jgi:hypothetical protein
MLTKFFSFIQPSHSYYLIKKKYKFDQKINIIYKLPSATTIRRTLGDIAKRSSHCTINIPAYVIVGIAVTNGKPHIINRVVNGYFLNFGNSSTIAV